MRFGLGERTFTTWKTGRCRATHLLQNSSFDWACECSCQRYLAITQTMVEPDPLKIRYRESLIQAMQAVVKGLRQQDQA
jgi:hypothetical protein